MTPPRKKPSRPLTVDEDRARRADLWGRGKLSGKDWIPDLEAIPRHRESEQISIRLPKKLLQVIRAMAERRSIGYQILLKDWLDDRARLEARRELQILEGPPPHLVVLRPGPSLGHPPEDLEDSEESPHHLKLKASA